MDRKKEMLSKEAERQLLNGIASGRSASVKDAVLVVQKLYLEGLSALMVRCLQGHGAEVGEIVCASMQSLILKLRSGELTPETIGDLQSWLWTDICTQAGSLRSDVWKKHLLGNIWKLSEEFGVDNRMSCEATCDAIGILFRRLRKQPFCTDGLVTWVKDYSRNCLLSLLSLAN